MFIQLTKMNTILKIICLSVLLSMSICTKLIGHEMTDHKITISVKDMPLGQVLMMLEAKMSYTLSYLNKELPLETEISLKIKNESLKEVLDLLSKKYALSFTTINKIITVKCND